MEALEQLTRLLAVLTFGALTVAALHQWVVKRVRAAGWLCLSFGLVAIAGTTLALVPDGSEGFPLDWLRKLSIVALALFPYSLYRFTTAVVPSSRRLDQIAVGATLLVVLVTLALPAVRFTGDLIRPTPGTAYVVALAAQFTLLSLMAGVRLWTSGRDEPGLVRRRMRVLAVATLGLSLSLTIALSLVVVADSATGQGLSLVVRAIALVSGLLFLLGFVAPRTLLLFGSAQGDERFQRALGNLMGASTGADVARALLGPVTEMTGARGAALVDEDGDVIGVHGSIDVEAHREDASSSSPSSRRGAAPGERIELPLGSRSLLIWTSPHTPVFGRHELEALSSLGQLAGLALDRVELYEREHKAHEALRRQIDFSRMLVDSSKDGILAFDRNYRYTLWNHGMEQLAGIKRTDAIGRSAFDVFPFLKEIGEDRYFDEALAGRDAVSHDRPFEVPETGKRGFFESRYAPLFGSEGDVVGGLGIITDVSDRMRAEQERAQRQREEVARAETEARGEMIEHLQRVTDTALAHLTLDDMVDELLARITAMLHVDMAALALMADDEQALVLKAATGLNDSSVEGLRVPLGTGFFGRVAAERRPLAIESLKPSDTVSPMLLDEGIHSVLAVPLLIGGRLIGALHVGHRERRRFVPEDATWLQLVADRVAVAVERAAVFERERRIAETLQRSLLPESLPEVPGMSVAARYLPGGAGAVGGDWYDVVPLGDGRLGLAMGDVVGHGTGAAALMGQMRSALRACALEDPSPAAVLGRLDRLLQSFGSSGMATLLYVVVDTDRSTAVLASAGHPPALVRSPSGATRFIGETPSPPLGVQAQPRFEERRFELEPGATLVLYTDGLIERRDATLDDGLRALERSVENAPEVPDAVCDHVVADLLLGAPEDDTALLVVQPQVAHSEHLSLRPPAEPRALAQVRSAMRGWLADAGLPETDAYEVLAACGEACANAVEHAYGTGEGTFEVDARREGGEVTITVRDFGTWRPPRGRERGRGLRLMEQLMDTSEVIRGDGGTTVRLARVLDRESSRRADG